MFWFNIAFLFVIGYVSYQWFCGKPVPRIKHVSMLGPIKCEKLEDLLQRLIQPQHPLEEDTQESQEQEEEKDDKQGVQDQEEEGEDQLKKAAEYRENEANHTREDDSFLTREQVVEVQECLQNLLTSLQTSAINMDTEEGVL